MKITGALLRMNVAREVKLAAFPMEGGRFGVGVYTIDVWGGLREFFPVRLAPSDAAALFPGMTATGRFYNHLQIDEIER